MDCFNSMILIITNFDNFWYDLLYLPGQWGPSLVADVGLLVQLNETGFSFMTHQAIT